MPDTIVVKVGGGLDPARVLDDVADVAAAGTGVVLVHGGGAEVDRLAGQAGVVPAQIVSVDGTRSRRTDAAALDVLTLALLGRVKPTLVAGLRARGADAVGLSGADGGLVRAERRPAIRSVEDGRTRLIRDDLSGRVTGVRRDLLDTLLDAGIVPVVSPPAAGADGTLLNVDADRVAAEVAVALGADALLLLTDVPGVLADPADPASVITDLDGDMPDAVTGRMRHKLRAATHAAGSVRRVVIGSGHGEAPVRAARDGRGTRVHADRERV